MWSKQRQKETPVSRKLSRNNMSSSLNMKKITILIVALASVLTSCSVNDNQNKDLRRELETLKKELADCKNGSLITTNTIWKHFQWKRESHLCLDMLR